jgi:hypothetical protein
MATEGMLGIVVRGLKGGDHSLPTAPPYTTKGKEPLSVKVEKKERVREHADGKSEIYWEEPNWNWSGGYLYR